MSTYNTTCEYVEDGDTFRTVNQKWIRLARYDAPEQGELGYYEAKRFLSNLILNKQIVYEPVSISDDRIIAEVWQALKNVNDIMINACYKKKK
jgi:endonuclease YncB( thermonuclease family)